MRFRVAIIFAGVCALLAACGEEKRSAEQDDMIEPDSGKGANNWLRAADHTRGHLAEVQYKARGSRQREIEFLKQWPECGHHGQQQQ
jgi:hypothetical protein